MRLPKQQSEEKKDYHHGNLKQALLEETAKILREEGEAALSLRRLASNLGVSRTAPYNHFESKEVLLRAVAEEGFRRFDKAMTAVRRRHRNSSGQDMARAVTRAYLNFALKNQEYYDLMYSSTSWREGTGKKSLSATARQLLLEDIERLKCVQQRGLITQDVDVAKFSEILWGALHGISRLSIDGVYSDPTSMKAFCDATADMFWAQLDPSR